MTVPTVVPPCSISAPLRNTFAPQDVCARTRAGRPELGQRQFRPLIAAAKVKRIKFHGLRHTVATLMLSAGVPPHVVQRRLRHSKIEMTLGVYAHALPVMQCDAAAKLAGLLHG